MHIKVINKIILNNLFIYFVNILLANKYVYYVQYDSQYFDICWKIELQTVNKKLSLWIFDTSNHCRETVFNFRALSLEKNSKLSIESKYCEHYNTSILVNANIRFLLKFQISMIIFVQGIKKNKNYYS